MLVFNIAQNEEKGQYQLKHCFLLPLQQSEAPLTELHSPKDISPLVLATSARSLFKGIGVILRQRQPTRLAF